MIKYVLFDLDGTLLSTIETITYHLNSALESHSLGRITVEDAKAFIGNGARKLVERALLKNGISDGDTVAKILLEYNRAYDSDPLPLTYPYAGIADLVDDLYNSGIKLAVVTNKPEPTARKLIEHFFYGKIDIVSGGRTGAVLKPDPTESRRVLSALGGEASECAFVGDTYVDIETGKNMGAALTVGVTWGFRSREELTGAGADFIADCPEQILSAIRKQI